MQNNNKEPNFMQKQEKGYSFLGLFCKGKAKIARKKTPIVWTFGVYLWF